MPDHIGSEIIFAKNLAFALVQYIGIRKGEKERCLRIILQYLIQHLISLLSVHYASNLSPDAVGNFMALLGNERRAPFSPENSIPQIMEY